MYLYLYTCMLICVYICINVFMYLYMYTCMLICVYICIYVFMFMYIQLLNNLVNSIQFQVSKFEIGNRSNYFGSILLIRINFG